MPETTCRVTDCAAPVFIKKRQLCKSHYARAWQAGEFGQLAPRHSVAAPPESTTGDCSECGPEMPVVRQADGRPICVASTRATRLKMQYGLTIEQVRDMLEGAGWACQVCQRALDETTVRIDHDHACCPGTKTCGMCVRGVLCHQCNVALGMFRDDPANLAAAAVYLTRKSVS